jgi:magnesium chelatase subunit H
MAASIGRDIEEVYRTANRGILSEVELLQQITEACRDCVNEFVKGEYSAHVRACVPLISGVVASVVA